MSDPKLGPSVVAARQFLTRIHVQFALLLQSLDEQLDRHGWAPTNDNVTSRVGARLNANRWLANYLYRFYFPKSAGEKSEQMLGVVIHLDPPQGFDEPTALAFAARFDVAQTHNNIWYSWTGSSQTITEALAGQAEVVTVEHSVYGGFLPRAIAFRGQVHRICSFSGEDDLRTRIVDPILAAETALGAKS